jgi:hypothetical protein
LNNHLNLSLLVFARTSTKLSFYFCILASPDINVTFFDRSLEWWSYELIVLLSGVLPNPALETSVLSIWYALSNL